MIWVKVVFLSSLSEDIIIVLAQVFMAEVNTEVRDIDIFYQKDGSSKPLDSEVWKSVSHTHLVDKCYCCHASNECVKDAFHILKPEFVNNAIILRTDKAKKIIIPIIIKALSASIFESPYFDA